MAASHRQCNTLLPFSVIIRLPNSGSFMVRGTSRTPFTFLQLLDWSGLLTHPACCLFRLDNVMWTTRCFKHPVQLSGEIPHTHHLLRCADDNSLSELSGVTGGFEDRYYIINVERSPKEILVPSISHAWYARGTVRAPSRTGDR
jgi:hypothetical protein